MFRFRVGTRLTRVGLRKHTTSSEKITTINTELWLIGTTTLTMVVGYYWQFVKLRSEIEKLSYRMAVIEEGIAQINKIEDTII
jgi:hypothetical protein